MSIHPRPDASEEVTDPGCQHCRSHEAVRGSRPTQHVRHAQRTDLLVAIRIHEHRPLVHGVFGNSPRREVHHLPGDDVHRGINALSDCIGPVLADAAIGVKEECGAAGDGG